MHVIWGIVILALGAAGGVAGWLKGAPAWLSPVLALFPLAGLVFSFVFC